ncbi:MAG: hypothetical protein IJ720_01450, partial [Clostridia bacterium]|nr:hypothetical protein [Clostridia bacterium]
MAENSLFLEKNHTNREGKTFLYGFSARIEIQQSGKGGAVGSGLESHRLGGREAPPATLCVEGA